MKSNKQKKPIMILAVVVILLTTTFAFASGYTGKLLEKETKPLAASADDKKTHDFLLGLDKTIAAALEINLNDYRKIDTFTGYESPEYDNLRLLDVKIQVPFQYGDSVLSIYLNKDNTQGIASTKEFKGLYSVYWFEANKDTNSKYAWSIIGTTSVEGEFKAINETVKEYFEKNPTPKDKPQQASQAPIFKESTSREQSPYSSGNRVP